MMLATHSKFSSSFSYLAPLRLLVSNSSSRLKSPWQMKRYRRRLSVTPKPAVVVYRNCVNHTTCMDKQELTICLYSFAHSTSTTPGYPGTISTLKNASKGLESSAVLATPSLSFGRVQSRRRGREGVVGKG